MDSQEIYRVADSALETEHLISSPKYGFWNRFYITFFWGLPIYLSFVMLGTPKNAWFAGAVGSVMFSIGSGIISMVIPVQRKAIIFVPIGIIVGVIIAMILGTYLFNQQRV